MKRWIFYLAIGFALMGCAQAFPTVAVSELPTQAPTELVQVIALAEPTEVMEPATQEPQPTAKTAPTALIETVAPDATDSVTATPTGEATVETVPAPPTETTSLGSSELHATNPANVQLASGKVQLVEFFAFW